MNNLVELVTLIPNITLDIKYATKDNFTKTIVYPTARCYLIKQAALALKDASAEFNKCGYTIKVWDGYRPLSVQHIFWSLVPDERYVASPLKGSRHNRGCAIDLTLLDKRGNELDMGTSFDDFTAQAHSDYKDLRADALNNRALLKEVMEKHDFINWKNEWWHFDFTDWEQYPILDKRGEEISNSSKNM